MRRVFLILVVVAMMLVASGCGAFQSGMSYVDDAGKELVTNDLKWAAFKAGAMQLFGKGLDAGRELAKEKYNED